MGKFHWCYMKYIIGIICFYEIYLESCLPPHTLLSNKDIIFIALTKQNQNNLFEIHRKEPYFPFYFKFLLESSTHTINNKRHRFLN